MRPIEALNRIHQGMNRRDLWQIVLRTGGTIEKHKTCSEWRLRYPHVGYSSAWGHGGQKGCARQQVIYSLRSSCVSGAVGMSRSRSGCVASASRT